MEKRLKSCDLLLGRILIFAAILCQDQTKGKILSFFIVSIFLKNAKLIFIGLLIFNSSSSFDLNKLKSGSVYNERSKSNWAKINRSSAVCLKMYKLVPKFVSDNKKKFNWNFWLNAIFVLGLYLLLLHFFLFFREMKVKGKREEITKLIFHVCSLLLENPPRGRKIALGYEISF